MKLKFIYINLLIVFLTGASLLAQNLPQNFRFGKNAAVNAASDDNPASNSVSDIVLAGDTVWIGTSRGLSLSTDRGETWTNFYGTKAFGTESVSALGYNNGVLWASTAHSEDKDGSSLPVGSGLRYTTDGGSTWNTVPQPLDDPGDSSLVYGVNDGVRAPKIRALPVTVAVQNIIYDIAFTPGTVWIATFAGGLRKSTDMGKTWQRVLLPADYLNEINPSDTLHYTLQPVAGKFGSENYLNHRVFSVVAANDSTLYVGTAGGINKSTDNGISWKKFSHNNQDDPISGNFVVAMGYNNANNTIWGATWKAEGQDEFYAVSASSDGGDTWQTYLKDERAHNFGFKSIQAFVTSDNGVFRSYDNGESWIVPGTITDSKTGVSLKTNIFYAVAADDGNTIWLGSNDGLARLDETSLWSGNWKVYFASQQLQSSESAYAYPNPFSPKLDNLKIKYSTGGKSAKVTIRIFDFGMNYVRTVVQNVDRGNPVHQISGSDNGVIDYWDGKDDSGNVVPNGVYFYRIDINSNDPIYGKILVLQ